MTTKYGIFLDLDETLVRTCALESLRDQHDWEGARQQFCLTWLPPGTREFLRDAAELGAVEIVTRAPREKYAEPLLAYHDLSNIRVRVAYDDLRHKRQKPHPHPIIRAAKEIGCAPEDCVYIGDQPSDMQAAFDAGAIPIGIQWPDQMPRGAALDAWRIRSSWGGVLEVIRELIADDFQHAREEMWTTPRSESKWLENRLSVFDYFSLYPDVIHPGTYWVGWFKKGDEAALRHVTEATIAVVKESEHVLRDDFQCAYIVSAPRHVAGVLDPSNHCERLAKELAAVFPWLTHLPAALARTARIRPSHQSRGSQKRPSMQEHLDSIRYVGPALSAPVGGIILLDDVLTIGATSDACRTILQQATGCASTIGLFAGRTVYGS